MNKIVVMYSNGYSYSNVFCAEGEKKKKVKAFMTLGYIDDILVTMPIVLCTLYSIILHYS